VSDSQTEPEFSITLHLKEKNGVFTCSCPKGLWAVSGPSDPVVMREAIHYFRQYARDGEYAGMNELQPTKKP